MSARKIKSAIADILAGTTLIIVGLAGALVRLGVLDFSHVPQWTAIEHWWPLLLIIVGLIVWLADMEQAHQPAHSGRSVEMPYGK